LKQLESVFLEHQRRLFASALAITRNRAAAEDAVHDALIAVAALSKAPDDMTAYLFRVVRNKALHSIKRESRHVELVEDYLDVAPGDAEQAALVAQVRQHMVSLSQDEQQVLILKLFEDMTFDEIAGILETSPNTVASWYRRGLEKLKNLIGKQ
jgi:RNA polymerase sigma-70 factor (ECF subfamily)